MQPRTYKIGQIAQEIGVTPQALRFYETNGFISKPQRTPSGYRIFSAEARARLLFLKRAQRFGFKLDEIKTLMGVKARRRGACAEVKKVIEHKLTLLDEQMEQIKLLRADLVRLRKECEKALAVDAACPVILDFSKTVSNPRPHEAAFNKKGV